MNGAVQRCKRCKLFPAFYSLGKTKLPATNGAGWAELIVADLLPFFFLVLFERGVKALVCNVTNAPTITQRNAGDKLGSPLASQT